MVSAYVLGYGGFLLLGGRAADLLGRRRMFLISLAVFVIASGLGGLANDGTILILTRFIKGVSAAFTAPAGLSIITTTFAEGPARNKALSVYTATGATGFSLGLVFGGLLTEVSWRWVLFLPVPLALATLIAAIKLVPTSARPTRSTQSFDIGGAVSITAAMLLLVFTRGGGAERGLGLRPHHRFIRWRCCHSGRICQRRNRDAGRRPTCPARHPSFRIAYPSERRGDDTDRRLVRFQFIATLYMQQLRGWSPLETGFAIFPGGLMVALLAPRIAPISASASRG